MTTQHPIEVSCFWCASDAETGAKLAASTLHELAAWEQAPIEACPLNTRIHHNGITDSRGTA